MANKKKFNLVKQYLLFVCVVLGVSCAASKVQRDTIVFSHHLHSEQGVECVDCHANVNEDAETKHIAQMTMDGCADCHDVEDDDGCKICHTNMDEPDTYPPSEDKHLKFSHQIHDGVYEDCASCHGVPSTVSKMAHEDCVECHKDELNAGKCNMCHERLDIYSKKPTSIYQHEDNFLTRHGAKAMGSEGTCAVCHDQAYCADCHNKNATVRPSIRFPERLDRDFMHAGDWMSRHSFEAKAGGSTCLKCHGNSSCASCHERNGAGGALGQRNPHPPSSVWLAPGTANSHSRAARRNISECATCHDQAEASNCVTCHRSGGVNPHPPGWRSPVDSSQKSSHPMCRICH